MTPQPTPGTGIPPPDLSSLWFTLTERAPLPMATVEGTGHILRHLNPAFCRLMHKPSEELIGKSLGEMLPEKDPCITLLDRVVRTGKPESHTENARSKPHPVFWSYEMWPAIVNESLSGIIIQVTETAKTHETTLAMNEALMRGSLRQHELTEAANSANTQLRAEIGQRQLAEDALGHLNETLEQRVSERTERLESANQELATFSYSVSHDLRAPLRQVMGFVQLLLQDAGPLLSENSVNYLATISRSARRMGVLIDDLLAFSRLGQTALKKADVNLDELARETAGDFRAEATQRNIAWKIHPLPAVRGDAALLRMVLVNLFSNAVKFTGARAEAKIEIGCASPGSDGETVIFIRDNGAGFDPQYAGKLFGVFQRLHSEEEFEGTGIGLANVQRIIHRHGGRVWAEGKPDAGATFYFSIPKQIVEGGSSEKEAEIEIPAPYPAPGG